MNGKKRCRIKTILFKPSLCGTDLLITETLIKQANTLTDSLQRALALYENSFTATAPGHL